MPSKLRKKKQREPLDQTTHLIVGLRPLCGSEKARLGVPTVAMFLVDCPDCRRIVLVKRAMAETARYN